MKIVIIIFNLLMLLSCSKNNKSEFDCTQLKNKVHYIQFYDENGKGIAIIDYSLKKINKNTFSLNDSLITINNCYLYGNISAGKTFENRSVTISGAIVESDFSDYIVLAGKYTVKGNYEDRFNTKHPLIGTFNFSHK